jgi:hypothetical protein
VTSRAVRVTAVAEMIDDEPLRNGSDKPLVGNPVDEGVTSETAAVAVGCSQPRPQYAAGVCPNDPALDPVQQISVAHRTFPFLRLLIAVALSIDGWSSGSDNC